MLKFLFFNIEELESLGAENNQDVTWNLVEDVTKNIEETTVIFRKLVMATRK